MLLIDYGNSAVKCRHQSATGNIDAAFVLQDESAYEGFKEYLRTRNAASIYVASVADEKNTRRLLEMIADVLPAARLERLVTLPALGGLSNAYHDHTQLGVDRWLTLLAAYDYCTHDSIIIDAGSAITIDLLSRRHGHLGGAILPGFNTSLQRFKALFPRVDFSDPAINDNSRPGRSTAACLQLPLQPVKVVDLNRIVDDWSSLLEAPLDLLLCGQDAGHIASELTRPHEVVADLVFRGMLQQIQLRG